MGRKRGTTDDRIGLTEADHVRKHRFQAIEEPLENNGRDALDVDCEKGELASRDIKARVAILNFRFQATHCNARE